MSKHTKWSSVAVSIATAATMLGVGLGATAHAASSHHRASRAAHAASGTIKYSDWEFPDNLNPYQSTEAVSYETINGTQDSLFAYNSTAHLIPWMATQVPTIKNKLITNGGKTITVHLKHGLRFSNGTPLTSASVKFSWHVNMDKATGPACSGSCDMIARIDTPNKYTVVYHLKQIFAPAVPGAISFSIWPQSWPNGWSQGNFHAAALKLAQDTSFNFEGPNYPSDGAYQVAQFINDDRIVLHPMKYWATFKNGGSVKNLIFAFYSSKPGMIAAAANHSTDITQDYTTADLPQLRQDKGAFKTLVSPGFVFEHLEFNTDATYNGKPNPLHNPNVRVALALALDKYGLIQSALGLPRKQAAGVAAWTPWLNVKGLVQPYADKAINGQWDPIQKKFVIPGTPKAVSDAKRLLKTTTCAHGCSLDFYTTSGNPTRANQEAVIAASWQKVGVKVNPNFIPASKFFASAWADNGTLDHGTFQVGMFAWLGGPEPDGWKYEMESKYIDRTASTHADINENYSAINNPVINAAFKKGAGTFNASVRRSQYYKIQLEMNKLSYWIGLFFRPVVSTTDGKVKNFSNNPTSAGPTWNMDVWALKR